MNGSTMGMRGAFDDRIQEKMDKLVGRNEIRYKRDCSGTEMHEKKVF